MIHKIEGKSDGLNDAQESPAVDIISALKQKGANLLVADPHIQQFELDGEKVYTHSLSTTDFEQSDLVLITTNHTNFNYEQIGQSAQMIFDTLNVKDQLGNPPVSLTG
jgi:UDP-N-acetyl-D-glucosamine dehydrogenase